MTSPFTFNTAFEGIIRIYNKISGKLAFHKQVSSTLTDIEAQVDSSDILVVTTTPLIIKLPDVAIDSASLKNVGFQPILVSFTPNGGGGGGGVDPYVVTLQPGGVIAFAGFQ